MTEDAQEQLSPFRPLQLAELEILDEVVAICEACGLRYYMLGGTLLGAVRGGRFIPWDDDIDIALPRADYEAFLEIAKVHLKEPFELFAYDTNPECRYSWARVTSPKVSERVRLANFDRIEDAWIDLIPLDGMPDNKLKANIHKMHLSLWWNLNQILQYDYLVDQHRKRGTLGTLAVKAAGCFKWLGSFMDFRICLSKLNDVLRLYDYDSPENHLALNYLAGFDFQELFPLESFGDGKTYMFEGRELVGPCDYDTVLTIICGQDYMTPPPLDERNKHEGEIIE